MNKMKLGISESRFSVIQFTFFAIAALFCFFTMFYNDMIITSQYGVVFLDSLFDRMPLSFYYNCVQANVTPEGAVYDIGIYIIFGIWSIPVWVAHQLTGIPVLHPICLLWYKVLLIVFLTGNAWILGIIAEKSSLSKESSSDASILFFITPLVFFPVFVAIQYDIIVVFFMLLGINAFLSDDYKRFLLFFAISLTMKPFPAFIMGALILLHQKNIFKIIGETILGASLMIICKVVYSFGPSSFQETNGSFLLGKFKRLFTTQITENYVVPVFVVMISAFYVYLWIKKDFGEGQQNKRWVLFTCGICMAIFCTFADIFPYWTAYFAPFSVLFLCWAGEKRYILADIVANGSLLLVFIYKYYWVYGGSETYKFLLMRPLWLFFDMAVKNTTVGGGLGRFGLGYIVVPLYVLFVLCEICMMQLIYKNIINTSADDFSIDKAFLSKAPQKAIRMYYSFWVLADYMFIFLTIISLVLKR